MRIDEFILARVSEDEAAAERGRRHNDVGTYANDNYGCLLVDPARVLAECEAKRRVVELHAERPALGGTVSVCYSCRAKDNTGQWHSAPCPTVRALAAVYADHPDFDPAWRL